MKRSAKAHWNGDFKAGQGNLTTDSLILNKTPYSFNTRFGEAAGSNPEELLAAAHAGCFTMSLAFSLSQAGFKPNDLDTAGEVSVDLAKGGITGIRLILDAASIDGVDEDTFSKFAHDAKKNCLLSKALTGVEISLEVRYNEVELVG